MMVGHIYNYAESLGTDSTSHTGATWDDKVTLSFTPGDDETWLIIASWQTNVSLITYLTYSRLQRTSGTPATLCQVKNLYRSSGYFSHSTYAVETYGSSPGAQTYKIQYQASTGAAIAYIQNASIMAIRLDSADKTASSVDLQSFTGDTNWHDVFSLTFTPDTEGDYLLMLSCVATMVLYTIASWKLQIDVDGTTQYDVTNQTIRANNENFSFAIIKKLTLSAASHTIKLQAATTNASYTCTVAYAYMTALRLSVFNDYGYAEQDTRATITGAGSDSYNTRTTLTKTLSAGHYLILASCGCDINQTITPGRVVYHQLYDGTSSFGEAGLVAQNVNDRHFPYSVSRLLTCLSQAYNYYLQYKVSNTAYTGGIQDARIAILQLEDTPYFFYRLSDGEPIPLYRLT